MRPWIFSGHFTRVREAVILLNRYILFNIPRSAFELDSCYSAFESIKDGVGVSPKYDSRRLHFKTPNVVMVFSNAPPDVQKLSNGRWTILIIKNKGNDLEFAKIKKSKLKGKLYNLFVNNISYMHMKII